MCIRDRKGYLIDPLNARRMGMEATGSARRQDYTFEPTSRMTNTFLLNGTSTFEEIIADTPLGLYLSLIHIFRLRFGWASLWTTDKKEIKKSE